LTTVTLLARAVREGGQIGVLCEAIHRREGEPGVVLALVKKYGAAAVEDACSAALELGLAN
jgi:hypothetical protein